MSMTREMTVSCIECGKPFSATVFESVHSDYAETRPAKIMSGELFRIKCPHCGCVAYLEYDVLYHDVRHEAMIWVLHKNDPGYASKLDELRSMNMMSCRTQRVVEDMNALKEKVSCLECGRDDRIVELCKVFTVHNLLAQKPGFAFRNAFYSANGDQERISINDEDGDCLYSILTDETYDFIRFLYLSSDFAEQYEDNNYPIIDYAWAEEILPPLMETSAEKLASAGIKQPAVKMEYRTNSARDKQKDREQLAQIQEERNRAAQKRAAVNQKTDIKQPVIAVVIAFAILCLVSVPLAKGTQRRAFNSQLRNFATEEMNDDYINVYADVVSIIPQYYVESAMGSSAFDVTDIICKCKTVEGKTIWVAIKVWEYPGGGSSDPSKNESLHYSKANPMRLTGSVDPAEEVVQGLESAIGDVFVLCVREMQAQ